MKAFEKVTPAHPDKVADRIAGAIVDMAYRDAYDPKVAAEVLLGHGECFIILESSWLPDSIGIRKAVERISGIDGSGVRIVWRPQDERLASNQVRKIRCGDNGIFCGKPVTLTQRRLTMFVKRVYDRYPYDGKYILTSFRPKIVCCQSHVNSREFREEFFGGQTYFRDKDITINPLGDWTGGPDVDAGATNRKLGSDMGGAVTGGGLHGKDLSKADVSVNIYAHLKAQETNKDVWLHCAIGDETVDGKPYEEIVEIARKYITDLGGFEKFAEWGLLN